jgi:hypothetical protein
LAGGHVTAPASEPRTQPRVLHGESSSVGARTGAVAPIAIRATNQNPGGWAGVLLSMGLRFDQDGRATTFAGAVTWFELSLTLVMSNE